MAEKPSYKFERLSAHEAIKWLNEYAGVVVATSECEIAAECGCCTVKGGDLRAVLGELSERLDPEFAVVRIRAGDWRYTFVFIGEGQEGDYDPVNVPMDEPFLRLDVAGSDGENAYSVCTNISVFTHRRTLTKPLHKISALHAANNHEHKYLEPVSHWTINEIQDHTQDRPRPARHRRREPDLPKKPRVPAQEGRARRRGTKVSLRKRSASEQELVRQHFNKCK